ncbi:hypothetical protein C8R47DRAFT_1105210 [Mycena vitilis]|nr:hypothetical protein C8R47DRAFT_1105210 [Mycena vitilis]
MRLSCSADERAHDDPIYRRWRMSLILIWHDALVPPTRPPRRTQRRIGSSTPPNPTSKIIFIHETHHHIHDMQLYLVLSSHSASHPRICPLHFTPIAVTFYMYNLMPHYALVRDASSPCWPARPALCCCAHLDMPIRRSYYLSYILRFPYTSKCFVPLAVSLYLGFYRCHAAALYFIPWLFVRI